MYGIININLADVALEQLLLQKHSVQFQLAPPSPTPGEPALPVGLREGSAVIGRFNGEHHPVSSATKILLSVRSSALVYITNASFVLDNRLVDITWCLRRWGVFLRSQNTIASPLHT
ncbi:hypothetical protein XENOCAPTIV_027913 [Xenoophorus captivus]|uniref:Uncharacterized protein n=1 Tax=Xenoophorus captivus TaxID=1517983 RepID=A0ABV0R6X7_9TELE